MQITHGDAQLLLGALLPIKKHCSVFFITHLDWTKSAATPFCYLHVALSSKVEHNCSICCKIYCCSTIMDNCVISLSLHTKDAANSTHLINTRSFG